MFELIPCLVISQGAVWLPPGNHTEIVSRNPLAVGLRFRSLGARTLYMVDLDSAEREYSLAPAAVMGLAQAGITVWIGGGIKTSQQAERLLAMGASAVVVRTAAADLRKLQHLVESVGASQIIVALETPRADGPERGESGRSLQMVQAASQLGIERFIVSLGASGRRLGMRSALSKLKPLMAPERWIGVGSGIRSSSDLLRVQASGLNAAIVGRALYDHPLDDFWPTDPQSDAG
jgi:phosphoribosylformimino-5-aminoimidazole carboxamide ribotide isomerase